VWNCLITLLFHRGFTRCKLACELRLSLGGVLFVWVPDVLVCESWRGSYSLKGEKFVGVSGVLVCLMRETVKASPSAYRTEGILVGVAMWFL